MSTFTPGEVVPPDDPRVVLEGQWGHQPGVAITVNSGSRIRFVFTGTRLKVLFDVEGLTSAPHLWVSIDDAEPSLYVVDQAVLDLTVDPGQHRVEIAVKDVDAHANRWNQPFGSAVVFAGPRLEFYGDSITQGVRALGAESGPEGSDGTRSFAYLTARAFGATSYQVGFGR